MNLRKDHSCDHAVMVMVGWCTGAKSVLRRLLCLQCATVVHPDQSYASEQILCLMHCAWILSATDVLVHMLMKGAAKCNNHCELQNSVNQLTIERRSALGVFLRACLCQCFYGVCYVFLTGTRWMCIKCKIDASTSMATMCEAWCLALWCICCCQSMWTWHQAK